MWIVVNLAWLAGPMWQVLPNWARNVIIAQVVSVAVVAAYVLYREWSARKVAQSKVQRRQ